MEAMELELGEMRSGRVHDDRGERTEGLRRVAKEKKM